MGVFCLLGSVAYAQESSPVPDPEKPSEPSGEPAEEEPAIRVGPVFVTGTGVDLERVGGAVQTLDEEALDATNYDDPNSVLLMIPGVYVRQEDAYGLRPNIGLRGANSERSKKVTLIEDGILFAPAPYSAPAAYYFPMMARITGVEVFKGPSAIAYGPNTIGGAINFKTRAIPDRTAAMVDLAGGAFGARRGHAWVGSSTDSTGVLLEAIHLGTSGFKKLDGGGDTGFGRSEGLLKLRWNSDDMEDVHHRIEGKLGISKEVSNETYLGLTDADFRADPHRRYAASALDRMDNWRTQATLGWSVLAFDAFEFKATLYRHDFARSWKKFTGFTGGPSVEEVLANPEGGIRALYHAILQGEEDSSGDGNDGVVLGTNDRTYVSQGVDALARHAFDTGPMAHEVRAGLRVHQDAIVRNHWVEDWAMTEGSLVREGGQAVSADTEASSLAIAGHLSYSASGWGLTLRPGIRVESIHSRFADHALGEESTGSQLVTLLGLGSHYAITQEWGLLAGVHEGFSPMAPGQDESLKEERSLNYEAGVRYEGAEGARLEVIGFWSEYGNLLAQCSFASGCLAEDLDKQFNAGEVRIQGVEVMGEHAFALPGEFQLPVRLSHAFTVTAFQSEFESPNPQLGSVKAGDELPYVPTHQLSLNVGFTHPLGSMHVTTTYLDAMREEAGSTDEDSRFTDSAIFVDLNAACRPLPWLELHVRAQNLLNAQPIVSRRPFGARPGKPFSVLAGLRADF